MMERFADCLTSPFDEPVDERRNDFHVNFIQPEHLGDRLTSQSYRPEIVAALSDLKKRHLCMPLSSLALVPIRQGLTPEYGGDGPPCLKLKDVRHVLVDSDTTERVSAEFARLKSSSVLSNEAVLINRSGGFTVGRSGVYLRNKSVFVSDDVFSFVPRPSCDAAFVACFLNSWWGKRALEAGINGSTGQLKLPKSHIEDLPIPDFPFEVQKAIGDRVRKADRLRSMAIVQRKLASGQIDKWYGSVTIAEEGSFGWLNAKKLSARRVDGWFHQPKYVKLGEELEPRRDLVPASEWCGLAKSTVKWNDWPLSTFDYFEIGGIDGQPGSVTSQTVDVRNAPSRAKFLVEPWDLLVSTVRPNLKNLALVPETASSAICSSGFSVLRSESPEIAGFLWACLSHDVATAQLMRWNSGGTYPAIERTVPLEVLIPNPGTDAVVENGKMIVKAIRWDLESHTLVNTVKNDVEALLAGTLDEANLLEQGAVLAKWLDTNPINAEPGADSK